MRCLEKVDAADDVPMLDVLGARVATATGTVTLGLLQPEEGMHRLANHCWASLVRWRSEGRDLGDLGAHSIVVSPAVLRDLMEVM